MSKPCVLGERDDLLLERRQAAVGEGADDDLLAGRPGRRAGRARQGREQAPAPAPPLSNVAAADVCVSVDRRHAHRLHPPVVDPVHHGGARPSKKHAFDGVERHADVEPIGAVKPRARADGELFVADAHVDERLVAHRLDDIDLARQRAGRRRLRDAADPRAASDLGDLAGRAGVRAAPARAGA